MAWFWNNFLYYTNLNLIPQIKLYYDQKIIMTNNHTDQM